MLTFKKVVYICKVIKNENKMKTTEILKSTIKTQSTSMLKKCALQLVNDFSEGAGIAFVFVLNELENRLSEKEFLNFTEEL